MKAHLNIVKKSQGKEGPYHHGALRDALIKASAKLIEERGVAEFSLREAARRAGVSASAPAHHFGGVRGLLTAVAAATFERVGETLEEAEQSLQGESAEIRFRGQARAYLRFALNERALFSLMWRTDLIDRASPGYSAAIRRSTGVLV